MHQVETGYPFPLGSLRSEQGLNLAVFSDHDSPLTLHLFDRSGTSVTESYPLDPKLNRTGNIWHIKLLCPQGEPILYAYTLGENPQFLLDPYAKALHSEKQWGESNYNPISLSLPYHNQAEHFDWGKSVRPHLKKEELILYEMHIRAFTKDASSDALNPGTYLGLIEKIPYLKSIGVNAVELMPVHEFHESEVKFKNPLTGEILTNFWGYSTVSFFSLMNRYSASDEFGAALYEFKQMVKALHENGIEVILDVVFNHTAEGNETGPTYHFKNFGKSIYYILEGENRFSNYSGCGNTFNCNHPASIELILASLRYFAVELKIDGFRFDLASIFSRSSNGTPVWPSALIEAITYDPYLSDVKLFSEPWDAAGLYQLGAFAALSSRWCEWNGKYRDAVRRFIKGSPGSKGEFATRISGSEDIFHGKNPSCSLNFVTVHDGFTLRDLVSYNHKHNEANGEDNRDGSSFNDSWNCVVEGATEDESILQLRKKQMKNFITALMLSQGVPLVLMGDEYGHTKLGNNNTWCQDNSLNYFDWKAQKNNTEFFRFFQKMSLWRKSCKLVQRDQFLKPSDITWHGIRLESPEWDDLYPFISFTLNEKHSIFAAFNAGEKVIEIETPFEDGTSWRWLVNTALDAPFDFIDDPQIENHLPHKKHYVMPPYSSLILMQS